ncbi:hypothetical protein AB0E06_23560 [Streptomyces sp. NPDC048109]|uniref:hypothetical protein n=1 Tax=unclassified Streptomyces TaxID=2593676 RepID=UPI0033E5F940
MRVPGRTWCEAELPTDEQAVGPLNAGVSPDLVLAHEALAVPGLLQRLGDGRGWHPEDLAYAHEAQRMHTVRVLSVLDPAKETLCVAGHTRFRHSEQQCSMGCRSVRRSSTGTAQPMRWPCSTWATTLRASRR